jgi:hypothetical protein
MKIFKYMGRTVHIRTEAISVGNWTWRYDIVNGPGGKCDGQPIRDKATAESHAEVAAKNHIQRLGHTD